MSLLKVLMNVSNLCIFCHRYKNNYFFREYIIYICIISLYIDLQHVDAIVDKQCQRRNEQLSEALSTSVREELQTELNRILTTTQDSTIRTIRDSIRENLSQQLTEISSAR